MARLGEAYVRIRADLRDYDKDLDAALQKSTDKFEKAFNQRLGKQVGKGFAAGISSEIDDALQASSKKMGEDFEDAAEDAGKRGAAGLKRGFGGGGSGSLTASFFKGIGGLLTDGLSGLPPQLKIAFGVGIVAATPVILAGVQGAVGAGIAAGVAGLGIALASQYEEVENSGRLLGDNLRESLVGAAEPFVEPLIRSMGRIDAFFESIQARLNSTFRNASTYLDPLTSGLLGFLDLVTEGLDSFSQDGDEYIDALADGMIFFGDAINEVVTEFGELGEEGGQALRDLLFAGADIIVFLGDLIRLSTMAYNGFREVATGTEWWNTAIKVLSPGVALAGLLFKDIDEATEGADEALKSYDKTSEEFIDTEGRSIRVTNAQTKALQEQADAINDLRDAQLDSIGSLVDYEDALADLRKGAKDNEGAFDFKSEGGRENIENYRQALIAAQKAATDLYLSHELTAEQAQTYYEQLADDAKRAATENGILKSKIDSVFGSVSSLIGLPPVPNKFGLLASAAAAAEESVRRLNAEMNRGRFTPNSTLPSPTGTSSTTSGSSAARQSQGLGGYAEGGVVTSEQLAWVGEGGKPEAILPLTNPRRTREIAAQTGLMNILGGDGASITNVYIGNEQLDNRMFRVVQANNASQARALNNSPRMI